LIERLQVKEKKRRRIYDDSRLVFRHQNKRKVEEKISNKGICLGLGSKKGEQVPMTFICSNLCQETDGSTHKYKVGVQTLVESRNLPQLRKGRRIGE